MTNVNHPFEHFGPAPYRVVQVREIVHIVPGAYARAGSTCDVCGTGIRWVYFVRAANGTEFRTGCDCAQKCGMSAKELKQARGAYIRDRNEEQRRAGSEARLQQERDADPQGLTRAERAQAAGLGRDAARRWLETERKVEAQHVGALKQRLRGLELRVDHVAVWEGHYGVTSLYIMRDRAGNAYTWKTSGGLATEQSDGTWLRPTEAGEFKGDPRRSAWFRCDATVKRHTEYEGLRQTEITRVAVKSMGLLEPVTQTRHLRAS